MTRRGDFSGFRLISYFIQISEYDAAPGVVRCGSRIHKTEGARQPGMRWRELGGSRLPCRKFGGFRLRRRELYGSRLDVEILVGPVTGPSCFRTQPRTTELISSQHGVAEFPLSQHRPTELSPSQIGSCVRQRRFCRYILGYREITTLYWDGKSSIALGSD